MLAVRLPKYLEKRLDALAKKTGSSQASHIREAVLQHISDLGRLASGSLCQTARWQWWGANPHSWRGDSRTRLREKRIRARRCSQV